MVLTEKWSQAGPLSGSFWTMFLYDYIRGGWRLRDMDVSSTTRGAELLYLWCSYNLNCQYMFSRKNKWDVSNALELMAALKLTVSNYLWLLCETASDLHFQGQTGDCRKPRSTLHVAQCVEKAELLSCKSSIYLDWLTRMLRLFYMGKVSLLPSGGALKHSLLSGFVT